MVSGRRAQGRAGGACESPGQGAVVRVLYPLPCCPPPSPACILVAMVTQPWPLRQARAGLQLLTRPSPGCLLLVQSQLPILSTRPSHRAAEGVRPDSRTAGQPGSVRRVSAGHQQPGGGLGHAPVPAQAKGPPATSLGIGRAWRVRGKGRIRLEARWGLLRVWGGQGSHELLFGVLRLWARHTVEKETMAVMLSLQSPPVPISGP